MKNESEKFVRNDVRRCSHVHSEGSRRQEVPGGPGISNALKIRAVWWVVRGRQRFWVILYQNLPI